MLPIVSLEGEYASTVPSVNAHLATAGTVGLVKIPVLSVLRDLQPDGRMHPS